MKRSEMIEKMANEIAGEYSWDGPKARIGLEYAYYIAENVLRLQEEAGMLPSVRKLKEPRFVELFNGQKITHLEVPEWEPEND